MAIGFTPNYGQQLLLEELTAPQFLTIALTAAKNLGWSINHVSEAGFIAFAKFNMSSWGEEVTVKIEGDTASLVSKCAGNQMVDWGKNKRNIRKLVQAISELKHASTPEQLSQQYEALAPGMVPAEQDVLIKPKPTTKENIAGFLSIFKPTKGYLITPILIDLNILIFILMAVSGVNILLPDNESLLKWGANFRPLTLEGEWWRLLTCCFLHIGIIHLLLNMYALLYIGTLLEPLLGTQRFIAAYLLTGIASSITSLWWHDLTISAGASGAIFGMYGVFLAMLTTDLIDKTAQKTLLSSIAIFVGYNLLFGIKGGIDNAAHIGGLISGLIIGYAYYKSLKNPEAAGLKRATIGILAVVILSASFMVYKKIPNDIARYDQKMKSFSSMESMALEVYQMPDSSSREAMLDEIKDRGLYYWNENIKLVTELDKLELPDFVHKRNKILLQYCDLRIKSYNLMYKAVDENTDKYKDSIDAYGGQIESIINSLK